MYFIRNQLEKNYHQKEVFVRLYFCPTQFLQIKTETVTNNIVILAKTATDISGKARLLKRIMSKKQKTKNESCLGCWSAMFWKRRGLTGTQILVVIHVPLLGNPLALVTAYGVTDKTLKTLACYLRVVWVCTKLPSQTPLLLLLQP